MPDDAWVKPVRLEGPNLILEPLAEHHFDLLRSTIDVPSFEFFLAACPKDDSPQEVERFARSLIARTNALTMIAIDRTTGQAVGCSSFMDIQPANKYLEIGTTWIKKDQRGTRVNPEFKWLMLKHAFEVLDCVRVCLKTDGRNLQSQAAITKLGAVKEGVLRRFGILPDGFIRDTVMFSILPEEWPAVKATLESRFS